MKFTVDSIAKLKLKPGETDRFEWDDEVVGWGIRIRRLLPRFYCQTGQEWSWPRCPTGGCADLSQWRPVEAYRRVH